MYFLRLEHATAVLAYLLFVVFFLYNQSYKVRGTETIFLATHFNQNKQSLKAFW